MTTNDLLLDSERRPGRCRDCGCTDAEACPGGCFWILPGLCSRCFSRAHMRPWTAAERGALEEAIEAIRRGEDLDLELARRVHEAMVLDPRLADANWEIAAARLAKAELAQAVRTGICEQREALEAQLELEASLPVRVRPEPDSTAKNGG